MNSVTAAQSARKIIRFLRRKKESLSPLLILTHDYPDPDALASAYALHYMAAQAFGIQSRIAYGGIIGRVENRSMVHILKLPVHKLRAGDIRKYENVALMDTQPGFENNSFPANRRPAMIIDQHPFVTKPDAALTIIDTECGATCVVLAQALLILKLEIPAPVATALAYGILTDTLNLYRSPRPDVIKTYLDILRFCDMRALAKIQNPARSRKFFTTLGKGIEQAMMKRGLMISKLGDVESPDLIAQVADFLLTYKGAHWAMCLGRFKGKLHVSLRMEKSQVTASEILRDIFFDRRDAGGHDVIAGGSFYIGSKAGANVWEEAEDQLIERILKRLRIPAKVEFYHPFRGKIV
ncbi:MAG: DHH family phosphoesterase [Candidatus Omnitrophica bacterium]|nr:DHH family phosphoesterase [Candidatus Omnitrophota bacterium]